MARGPDWLEGLLAIVAVAGTGGVLVLCAGVLWAYSYAFAAADPALASYRTEARPNSGRREELRGLAIVLVVLCAVTQGRPPADHNA